MKKRYIPFGKHDDTCDTYFITYQNLVLPKSLLEYAGFTAQKMKFSTKDFSSKCDQIRIWSHLLEKFLMENFIFCAVLL